MNRFAPARGRSISVGGILIGALSAADATRNRATGATDLPMAPGRE